MNPITISRGEAILAHHTTESCLSHYGQAVWVIEEPEPDPGPVIWKQGETQIKMNVLAVRGGWLICRQPGGLLCGILWSDGGYYANLLETRAGRPCKSIYRRGGQRVRGTMQVNPDDPDDLGAVLAL